MRSLLAVGPAADQDAIAAATEINDISITVTDRSGPVLLFGQFGFTDTDVLAVVTELRILQEGAAIPGVVVTVETGAVDNLRCTGTVMAFVENVAIGQTFQLRITPFGTGVDVKRNNCSLLAIGMEREGAFVANFVSP